MGRWDDWGWVVGKWDLDCKWEWGLGWVYEKTMSGSRVGNNNGCRLFCDRSDRGGLSIISESSRFWHVNMG